MKQLLRKDVILFVVLAFSAIFMAVSNPDNLDIRVLVWDYAVILLMAGSILWVISEVLDWMVSLTSGVSRPVAVERMSRDGLIVMAEMQGLGSKKDLGRLTDEDLAALVVAGSSHVSEGGVNRSMTVWSTIVYLIRFCLRFVSKVMSSVKGILSLVTMSKAKRSKKIKELSNKIKKDIHEDRR